jgi:CRP-like cAMP-binding protein
MAKVLSMGPGDQIMHEGDKSDSIFFLQAGKLNVFVKKDGKPTKIGEIGPGELVGEMAFVNHAPRSATVVAAVASELVQVSKSSFEGAIDGQAPWLKAFIKSLIKRIGKANTE